MTATLLFFLQIRGWGLVSALHGGKRGKTVQDLVERPLESHVGRLDSWDELAPLHPRLRKLTVYLKNFFKKTHFVIFDKSKQGKTV